MSPVLPAEQMVDIGLDRHGLPHILLGLPIFGIEGRMYVVAVVAPPLAMKKRQ